MDNPIEEYSSLPEEIREAAKVAKDAGERPYWVAINGQNFIYRPIKRNEWKSLTREQNKEIIAAKEDQLALSEIKDKYVEAIVSMCMLWSSVPVDDSLGAGYVDTLSDAILIDSGFGQPDTPSVEV